METRFESSFNRDLRRTRNSDLRRRVLQAIENVESASRISEVPGIRRIRARGNFYRIRVGDYRIGLEVEGNLAILERFAHRSEIYQDWP